MNKKFKKAVIVSAVGTLTTSNIVSASVPQVQVSGLSKEADKNLKDNVNGEGTTEETTTGSENITDSTDSTNTGNEEIKDLQPSTSTGISKEDNVDEGFSQVGLEPMNPSTSTGTSKDLDIDKGFSTDPSVGIDDLIDEDFSVIPNGIPVEGIIDGGFSVDTGESFIEDVDKGFSADPNDTEINREPMEETVKIPTVNDIVGGMNITGNLYKDDSKGTVYGRTDSLAVSFSTAVMVDNMGISSLELFVEDNLGTCNTLTSFSNPNPNSPIDTGNIPIETSFEGTLKLKYTLSNGMSFIIDAVSDSSNSLYGYCNYVIDDDIPTSGVNMDSIETVDGEDDLVYLTSEGTIGIIFSDSLSGIDSSTLEVEGITGFDGELVDGVLKVKVGDLQEGLNTITYRISDMVGNSYENTLKLYKFLEEPVIEYGSVSGLYNLQDGITYIDSSNLYLEVLGYRNEKFKSVELVNSEGTVLEDLISSEGKCTLQEGTYFIKTVDILGRENLISLSELTNGILTDELKYDNISPVISEVSTGIETKVNTTGTLLYTGEGTFKFDVSDVGLGIDSVEILEDKGFESDIKVSNDKSLATITIDSKNLQEGLNTFKIQVSDISGNITEKEVNLVMYRVFPTLIGENISNETEKNGTLYSKDSITLYLKGIDSFGIGSIELTEVEDNGYSLVQPIENGIVTIDKSGTYAIKVTDFVGDIKYFTLENLFNESSNIVIDSEAPVINSLEYDGKYKEYHYNSFYLSNGNLKFDLSDSGIGVDSSTIKVMKGSKALNYSYDSDSGVLSVPTSQLAEGYFKISVQVSDDLENTSQEYITEGTMYRDDYELYGSHTGKVYVNKGITYIDKLDLQLNGLSSNKIKSAQLLKDNKPIKTLEVGKENVNIQLNKTGNYSIKVEDIKGDVKTYSLTGIFTDITSNIVVDTEYPMFGSDITDDSCFLENKGIKYYIKDCNIVLELSDKLSGLDINSLKANVVVGNSNGFSKSDVKLSDDGSKLLVSTKHLQEGNSRIKVSIADNMGNTAVRVLDVYMIRNQSVLEGTGYTGRLVDSKGTSYFKEPVKFTIKNNFNSTTDSIKLLKDGKPIEEIKHNTFTITDSGIYSIRLSDIAGRVTDYSLKELYGVSNSFVKDVKKPVLEYKGYTGDVKTIDGVNYFTSDGIISYKIGDSLSGLGTIEVNGIPVESYNITDDEILIDTSKIEKDKPYNLSIKVSDTLGNSISKKQSFYLFRITPELVGESHDSLTVKGNTGYINKILNLKLKGYDNKKIHSIELYKDGIKQCDIDNGVFSIQNSGHYTVKVTDLLYNIKIYDLSDLFNDMPDNIQLDTELPKSSLTINSDEIDSEKWVITNGKLKVDVSDNVGIESFEVDVNGTKFTINSKGKKEDSKVIDLKLDVPRNSMGTYLVKVYATDITGNKDLIAQRTILVDFDNPEVLDTSFTGNITYNGDDNIVYFRDSIKLSLKANDVGSGIKGIYLYKDGKHYSELNRNGDNYSTTITESGVYTLKVVDRSGLYISLDVNSILGTSSNSLVVDNIAPTLEQVSGFRPDLVLSGKNWYREKPTVSWRASDLYGLSSIRVVVNGKTVISTKQQSKESVYTVPLDSIIEGINTIEIEGIDKSGNVVKDSYNFDLDTKAPTALAAKGTTQGIIKGSSVFFKSKLQVNTSADDSKIGSGIKEYILYDNDRVVDRNSTGSFDIGNSGSYSVECVDNLGNTTGKQPLGSLLGYSTSDFVLDYENPTISIERGKADYKDTWYGSNPIINVTLNDSIGIDSYDIKINGVSVKSSKLEGTGKLSENVIVNTSMVETSSDGSYEIDVEVVDNSGNVSKSSDLVYVDSHTPTIDKFVFTGSGNQEGKEINGSNIYGFFFNGSAYCDIYVSDGSVSSGYGYVDVTLENSSGTKEMKQLPIKDGVSRLQLPDNFKGFISATVSDTVGHVSNVYNPDGVVLQNSSINTLGIDITLPDTKYSDVSGNSLYSSDASAKVHIDSGISGIRELSWGIDGEELGKIDVGSNGELSGNTAEVVKKDSNLVVDLSKALSMQGNANGLKLWVKAVDRGGNISESSKLFSIDKDSPVISVSYSSTENDNYYNSTRSAVITVKERNFNPEQFSLEGTYGSLGNWVSDGDKWTNTLTFAEDKDYQFTLNCIDRAGNVANSYTSEAFTVDKTAPVLSVSWDNNSPDNGNYYNKHRVATVKVVEHNFDPSLFSIQGTGSVGGWISNGDVHTLNVSFNSDGEHTFSISGSDRSGNQSNEYVADSFNIDATVPTLEISGIENGVSYKSEAGFSVKMSDSNLDTSRSSVSLTGRKNGSIRVNGIINNKTGEFSFKDIPKEEYYDDLYTLSANVYDKAGNLVTKDIVFSINRFGSKFTFNEVELLNTYMNVAKDISISETNVDRLDIAKARVSVVRDGSELDLPEGTVSIAESGGSDDKYTYTYTVDKEVFNKDGKYTVQVYSQADDGTKYSSVSEEYSFVLDTVNPEIIISGISDGDVYKDYKRKVTVDIRDGSGIKDIAVKLNDKPIEVSKENGIYYFNIQENKDKQNLEVSVTDLAGNKNTKIVKDFVISSDTSVYIMNQWWFKWGIGAVITFLGIIISLIARSIYLSKKEEKKQSKEFEELYKTSGSLNTSSENSSKSEDDIVTDILE